LKRLIWAFGIGLGIFAPLFFVSPANANELGNLKLDVYTFTSDSQPIPDASLLTFCKTTYANNIEADWGGDNVLDCGLDFVAIHYTGSLTFPSADPVFLMNMADDGFQMSLDGLPIISDWVDKGCGGTQVPFTPVANHVYELDAWWYEWGGGACSTLYFMPQDGTADWTPIPASWYANVPVIQEPLNAPTNVRVKQLPEGNVEILWDAPVATSTNVERYAVSWSNEIGGWGVASTETNIYLSKELFILTGGLDKAYTFTVRSDNDTLRIYSSNSAPVQILVSTPVLVVMPQPSPKPVPEFIPPVVEPTPVPAPVEEPVAKPAPIPEPPAPEPPAIPEPAPNPPSPIEPAPIPVASEPEVPQVPVAEPEPAPAEIMAQLAEEAKADDPVIPAELAAIPFIGDVAGQVLEAFNALGNVGADMTPEVREKSEKVVIASVIVGNIATTASMMASASTVSTVRRKE
jgi:hypothetical protein